MKSTRQKQELIDLFKDNDNYTRYIIDIRHTISRLYENFNKKKGQSNQLLNENEWMHSSYLAELKV